MSMSHLLAHTSTGPSTPTPAARWLYTHILPTLLLSLTPISAAPISSDPLGDAATADIPPSDGHTVYTDAPELVSRALGRPYYGGGYYNGNGGGVDRKDLWKIIVGVVGGVVLLLGLAYLIRGHKQRKRLAGRRSNPPGTSIAPTHTANMTEHTHSTPASTRRNELAPGTGGRSFQHRYTPSAPSGGGGGIVSNARSAGTFGRNTPTNDTSAAGGEAHVQAPAPAYMKDAPASSVLAVGPPKYESAPTSPVNATGGSAAGYGR